MPEKEKIVGKLEKLRLYLRKRDVPHASETMILSNTERILKLIKENRVSLEWLRKYSKLLLGAIVDKSGGKESEVRHEIDRLLKQEKSKVK